MELAEEESAGVASALLCGRSGRSGWLASCRIPSNSYECYALSFNVFQINDNERIKEDGSLRLWETAAVTQNTLQYRYTQGFFAGSLLTIPNGYTSASL